MKKRIKVIVRKPSKNDLIMDPENLLSGTIDQMVQKLYAIREFAHKNGISDLFFESEHGWDHFDLTIYGYREETDVEYDKRLSVELVNARCEATKNDSIIQKEKLLYEQLKQKYS